MRGASCCNALSPDMTWQYYHHRLRDRTGADRVVSVALPAFLRSEPTVVFCADGQAVQTLSESIAASDRCDLPILIGVHSQQSTRAQDYLFNDTENYLAHEDFFVRVLRSWAHAEYDVPITRSTSVMFGFSNGGAFALTAVLRHSELFAAAFSFSTPKLPTKPSVPDFKSQLPAIYLAAGSLGPEKQIRKNVLQLARWLQRKDVPVTVSEKQAGHTLDFWASELPIALEWFQSTAA